MLVRYQRSIKRLALGLAIIVIVPGIILIVLSVLDIYEGSELSLRTEIANNLLIVVVAVFVAFIAAFVFSNTGAMQILLLGGGALAFGASSWFRAWIDMDANAIITVQDSVVLISSVLHLSSAALWFIKRKILVIRLNYRPGIAIFFYLVILAVVLLIIFIASRSVTPVLLLEAIRGIAAFFYVLASFMTILVYSDSHMGYYYWYSIGLALFGFGVFFISQGPLDSMIAWMGRIAHYIGGIYFLVSVISSYYCRKEK